MRDSGRLVLVLGALVGAAIFYPLSDLPFDFSADLEEAQRLGIHGALVLSGYPKSLDVLRYLLAVALPIGFSAAFYFAWSRQHPVELAAADGPIAPPKGRWVLLAALAVFTVWFTFDRGSLYQFDANESVGTWPMMLEEGAFVAFFESISHGAVYARDFHCEYGPLLVYGVVAFERLFGPSLLATRLFTWSLFEVAYALAIGFAFTQLRTRTAIALTVVAYLVLYQPFGFTAPHTSAARAGLGVLPLLLAAGPARAAKLVGAGLAVAVSFWFSQEVGICSALAAAAMVVVPVAGEPSPLSLGRRVGFFAAGAAAGVLPPALFFAAQGALGELVSNLGTYPKLFRLGWGGLPFPDFKWVLWNADRGVGVFHWIVIGAYVAAACALIPNVVARRFDPRTRLRLGLLIFGLLLFRSALGRSDETHVLFASQPLFFLAALSLERSIARVAALRGSREGRWAAAALAVIVLAVAAVVAKTARLRTNLAWAKAELLEPSRKWRLDPELLEEAQKVPRAGVSFGSIADDTLELGRFLDAEVPRTDEVFFFPNEALYYFIFDRPMPTRFAWAYQAVTTSMRQELIDTLERKRVRWIVYSPNTWRLDRIDVDVAVPEVLAYLQSHYRFYRQVGQEKILVRNPE